MFYEAKSKYGDEEWTPNIVKDVEKAAGENIRAPNFPDKMMDYEDVVEYIKKQLNK